MHIPAQKEIFMADVNFGPLKNLIGIWKGEKGMDIAPDQGGKEENPFYETIVFEGVGDLKNAESQTVVMVRYLQIVRRKSNDEVFHDETGYWMWDPNENIIMQSLVIPRAVAVLCSGTYSVNSAGEVNLKVSARLNDANWGILQSPFMEKKAKTLEFKREFTVSGSRLKYFQNTIVDIYGKVFDHTDENELMRV